MRFTKIRPDTFERLQLNAGILIGDTPEHYLKNSEGTQEDGNGKKHVFDSAKALMDSTWNDVLGSTTGGVTFEATPTFTDFGEDIDNCPKNMKELKRVDSWDVTFSGSFVMLDPSLAARLMGSAQIAESVDDTGDEEDEDPEQKIEKGVRVRPLDLDQSAFFNLWWIGDYGSDNADDTGGYLVLHMWNALSTGGFHFTSADNEKGTFDFEFTGHYDMDHQERIPFDLYIGSHDIDDPDPEASGNASSSATRSALKAAQTGSKSIDGAGDIIDALVQADSESETKEGAASAAAVEINSEPVISRRGRR